MLKSSNICRFGHLSQTNTTDIMQTQAEIKLNPLMYIVKYECDNNISQAANRIGISRPWLSQVHGHWKNHHEDPRSLEPESRERRTTRLIENGLTERLKTKSLKSETNIKPGAKIN